MGTPPPVVDTSTGLLLHHYNSTFTTLALSSSVSNKIDPDCNEHDEIDGACESVKN